MSIHIVSSNQIVSGINLRDGDSMTILYGGIAIDTTVHEGGKLSVGSGGLVSNTTVSRNGIISVSNGGKAINTILSSVDFLFARGNPDSGITAINNPSRSPLVSDYAASSVGTTRTNECSSDRQSVLCGEEAIACSDLSRCKSTSVRELYSVVERNYQGLALADQIHLIALIYAINTDGETLSSKDIYDTLGYEGVSGQFCYYARIVKAFHKLGYHIDVIRKSDRIGEDIRGAGIDGFIYGDPVPVRIYNFLMNRNAQMTYYALREQDISHLVSFLYTVATNEKMPVSEYDKFEHGPTVQQYNYYHRSVHPLSYHGYQIVVRQG